MDLIVKENLDFFVLLYFIKGVVKKDWMNYVVILVNL